EIDRICKNHCVHVATVKVALAKNVSARFVCSQIVRMYTTNLGSEQNLFLAHVPVAPTVTKASCDPAVSKQGVAFAVGSLSFILSKMMLKPAAAFDPASPRYRIPEPKDTVMTIDDLADKLDDLTEQIAKVEQQQERLWLLLLKYEQENNDH